MIQSAILAWCFAGVAVLSLVELIRASVSPRVESYIADREAHAVHVVMNGGMAAMVAPFYGAGVERGIVILYGVAAAVLVVRIALLWRSGAARLVGGSMYHLLGLVAMLYAVRAMPVAMAGMRGMEMAPGWTGWMLSVIFALDGLATAVLAGLFPAILLRMERSLDGGRAAPSERSLRAIRLAAIPHCMMDFGMLLMLLG